MFLICTFSRAINSSFLTVLEVQSSLSIHQRLALGPTPDTKIRGYSIPSSGHVYLLLLIYSSTYHETWSTVCIYWEKNLCISGLLQFKPLLTKVSCIQSDVESWLHPLSIVLIPLLFGPRSSSTIIGPSFLHFSSSKFWFPLLHGLLHSPFLF